MVAAALHQDPPRSSGLGAHRSWRHHRLCSCGSCTRGLAVDSDLQHTEAGGRIAGAEPDKVSQRALERGYDQCGTLGSGNHFMEVQVFFPIGSADVKAGMKTKISKFIAAERPCLLLDCRDH